MDEKIPDREAGDFFVGARAGSCGNDRFCRFVPTGFQAIGLSVSVCSGGGRFLRDRTGSCRRIGA